VFFPEKVVTISSKIAKSESENSSSLKLFIGET